MKLSSRLGDERRPARATSGLASTVQARRQAAGSAPAGRRVTTRQAATATATTEPSPHVAEAAALDDLRTKVRTAVVAELGPRLAGSPGGGRDLRRILAKHLDKTPRTSPTTGGPGHRA